MVLGLSGCVFVSLCGCVSVCVIVRSKVWLAVWPALR